MKNNISEKGQAEHLCPFSPMHVKMLDGRLRRFFQNPEKILKGLISPGMTVIDIGCGPGTFTRTMAKMAGDKGTVIACDVQEEMLEFAKTRLEGCDNYSRIKWHMCNPDSPGLEEGTKAAFILSFYMVHEVRDMDKFFCEVYEILEPGGRYLVSEPKFHVSEKDFDLTLKSAENAGFLTDERPKISMSRSVLLGKKISVK